MERYYMVTYMQNGLSRCMALFAVRSHAVHYCESLVRNRHYSTAKIQEVMADFEKQKM